MEIKGKIIEVLEKKTGTTKTGNAWASQEYVIETEGQYPKKICFNVFGEDKITEFGITKGCNATIQMDINAREYQGRWYNDIRAWKVECEKTEIVKETASVASATDGDEPF